MPKKPKVPKWARSMAELGAIIEPPRAREIIQRALKIPGNPGRADDGRYAVKPWEKFINDNFESRLAKEETPSTGDKKRDLEIEKLRLSNQRLELDLEVRRKNFTANADIERWVGEMVMNAKTILTAMPAKLAPRLVGRLEPDIERIIREEVVDALTQLSGKPWITSPSASPTENEPS